MAREYVLQPYRDSIKLQIDYEAELNDEQRTAVTALPGPALVIAGAGSGKTRTLTYRVAYLLEQGVPAERILLLTFTNKAAGEMKERIRGMLDLSGTSPWVSTFHSFCLRMLRKHISELGFSNDFAVLTLRIN